MTSDSNSILIDIDGACSNNGYYGAIAGYGVFFADDSYRNIAERVPSRYNQTNQVAELYAAKVALDKITEMLEDGECEDVSRVVICTDSAYLVNGVSDWVWKWEDNGYINAKGSPVVNGDLFEYLHDKIGELQSSWRVEVNFWKVPREENEEADALARSTIC